MNNDQFLKYVMEGMGEQPSDNMLQNWNTIMNFVPSYSGNVADASDENGPMVKLTFTYTSGGLEKELECPETMLLKDCLANFARMANISNETLNKMTFLCNGINLNINKEGTLKSNNLNNGAKIVVVDNMS